MEKELIRDTLDEGLIDTDYRQLLLASLERWPQPSTGDGAILALPALVCEACGGDLRQAVPVCAAWRLLRLAAKLFDDVEDGDVHERLPEIVNTGLGLVFVGQLVLYKPVGGAIVPAAIARIAQELSRAGLVACGGQHADLRAGELDPDQWLKIAMAKSGVPFGWGAWAGAMVTGTAEGVAASYRDYGSSLGVLLQIADDYNGVWCPEQMSDLVAGRPTLPVAYALAVANVQERSQLQTLLARACQGDTAADTEARQLLIDMGAQGFMLVVGQMQQRQAVQALHRAGGSEAAQRELLAALEQIFPALRSCEG